MLVFVGTAPYQRVVDTSDCTELNESNTGSSPGCPLTCYWVSPPPESRPQELARPMAMKYNMVSDTQIDQAVHNDIVSIFIILHDFIIYYSNNSWNSVLVMLFS